MSLIRLLISMIIYLKYEISQEYVEEIITGLSINYDDYEETVSGKRGDVEFCCDVYSAEDIIGEYLVMNDLTLSNEQITNEINSRYSQLTQKKTVQRNLPLAENDGIDARIIAKTNPNEPMYTARISVNKLNEALVAHIEEQNTSEEYRQQGLMSKVVTEFLPIYCASNNLSAITLEAGAIDGVDKATLEKIYTGLGFEQQDELFIRPVTLERSDYTRDNSTFEM